MVWSMQEVKSDYQNWHMSSELSLENIIHSFKEIEQPVDSSSSSLSLNKMPVNDVSEQHHQFLNIFLMAVMK